jgi:hypothetical protein
MPDVESVAPTPTDIAGVGAATTNTVDLLIIGMVSTPAETPELGG